MTDSRSGALRGLLALGGMLAIGCAALGVSVTQAGFTNEFQGTGAVSGSIDIAQSADGADQHATVDDARLLTEGAASSPILALDEIPTGWPAQESVTFPATVYSLGETLVDVRVRIVDLTDDEATPYPSLLFGVRANGEIVGDGTPIAGPWFDDHPGGIVVAERLAPNTELRLDTSVWLRGDAPDGHWAVPITVGLQIIAETVGGDTIVLEGEWR
ncbi:hypothetical protein ACFSWE_02175 [Leucobacter albus]|uniref:Ribosomally synthesized peptide with SipW-like signal peptide n=1 Tax=Leucobacter albus TaxID=272210 RepID=A0ABW3TLV0_9MICO